MASAYQCDRCGKIKTGQPMARLGIDELQDYEEYGELSMKELCVGCQMDFWNWIRMGRRRVVEVVR